MSWYRRIKNLFTVEYIIFFYIVWSTINLIVTKKHISSLYILNLVIVIFLMQYISHKKDNKALIITICFLLPIPINYIISKNLLAFLLNHIYFFFVALYSYRVDKIYIDYNFSKEIFKKSLIIIMLLWFTTIIFGNANETSFFRFYIIYFILGIIYLRKIRDYNYNILSKKSIIIDGVISLFILSFCIEPVHKFFLKIIMWIKNILIYAVDIFINILVYVLNKPYTAMINSLRKVFKGKEFQGIDYNMRTRTASKFTKGKYTDITFLFPLIKFLLFTIVLIIVCKIISNILSVPRSRKNTNVIMEDKEIIKIDNKEKKKGFLKRILDNVYLGKDPRKKIRYFYRILEAEGNDKQLFDEHMTATQFENSIKINRDVENEDLSYITNKYNKVKFSMHEIHEEEVDKFQSKYHKIKKKI